MGVRIVRSRRELSFRLRQEIADLGLLVWTPSVAVEQHAPLARLPDPRQVTASVQHTEYAAEILRLGRAVLTHRFPLFGTTVETGDRIAWRRDYVNGIESGTAYFRHIPYLDFARTGDHKVIWELNRHQHLVLLAQAFSIGGAEEFLDEIRRQVESWTEANPYMRGINWSSALEVAFRALSWLWVYHLTGARLTSDFRQTFLTQLYRHGVYIEHNLSVYFSPNTHLLGEAVALHALGVLFPAFPRSRHWEEQGGRIVREQMDYQVRPDGSHFEQSTYYHVYALDMFLFHYVLSGRPAAFRERVLGMAEYLHTLMDPCGNLPFVGDDDGGRLFHPYGPRDRFGRATLATCACLFDKPQWIFDTADLAEQAAWWIDIPPDISRRAPAAVAAESRFFPHAGVACMRADDIHIVADAGPFGFAGAGHSHSDTLSLVARKGREEILIDAGTFTYIADAKWRNWFRSSAAHNTIRIGEDDQAIPISPFRWAAAPEVELRQWKSTDQYDFMDATCGYRSFSHRRRFFFLKPRLLFILDEIAGPGGKHRIEQFWHPGLSTVSLSPHLFRIGSVVRLLLPEPAIGELSQGGEHGWRSCVFGQKEEAPVIQVSIESQLPLRLRAVLDFAGREDTLEAVLHSLELAGAGLPEFLKGFAC